MDLGPAYPARMPSFDLMRRGFRIRSEERGGWKRISGCFDWLLVKKESGSLSYFVFNLSNLSCAPRGDSSWI